MSDRKPKVRPRIQSYTPKSDEGLLIIDVSSYQGDIDWQKLKSKIDGAIIRVGFVDDYFGGNEHKTDPYFLKNQSGARSIGLKPGYYYYAFADESPMIEADRFVKGAGKIEHGESFWLDIEERENEFTLEWVTTFINYVESHTNRICHIYTDINWIYENKWISETKQNSRHFWLAYHARFKQIDLHSTPVGNIIMHQYSRRARLPGIKTKVDVSHFYGDHINWLQLAAAPNK